MRTSRVFQQGFTRPGDGLAAALVRRQSAAAAPARRKRPAPERPVSPRVSYLDEHRITLSTPSFRGVSVVKIDEANARTATFELALHGLPGMAFDFMNIAPQLAAQGPLRIPEMPGYGRSLRNRSFDPLHLGGALFIDEVLEALGMNKPGISMNVRADSLGCNAFVEYLLLRHYRKAETDRPRPTIFDVTFCDPSMPVVRPLVFKTDVHWPFRYTMLSQPNVLGVWDYAQRGVLSLFGGKIFGTGAMYDLLFASPKDPALSEWKTAIEGVWIKPGTPVLRWEKTGTFIDTIRYARRLYGRGNDQLRAVVRQLGMRKPLPPSKRQGILYSAFKEVRGKVRVVLGEKDQLISPVYKAALARDLNDLTGNVEVTVLPNAGHMSVLEDSAATLAACTRA